MGGGGGTSGKVSYPAFMVDAHNEIMTKLTDPTTGWCYTIAETSPWNNKTAFNPQTTLQGMTDVLVGFEGLINDTGPKYNGYTSGLIGMTTPTITAFSGVFDGSASTYGIAGLTTDNMYIDIDTYDNLDTLGWSNVAPDTWVDANEMTITGVTWTDPTTDYLSTINISGIYTTAYNAIMSRKNFTEQYALKNKFRNMGAAATSAFPIAMAQIEKAAAQEAMQVVLSFLKDRNMLSEERLKAINLHNLESERIKITKRELKHRVLTDKSEIGLRSVGANTEVVKVKHGVKLDRTQMIAKASEISLAAAGAKVDAKWKEATYSLDVAKTNATFKGMQHDWEHRLWATASDFKIRTLNFWSQYQDIAMRLTATIIAANVDYINQQIEYSERDKLWHAEKFDYINRATAAMSGGGSSAGTKGPSKAQSTIAGAASGAALGASVGSVVPGVGTAMGAGIGGVIGGAAGYFGS